MKSFHIHIKGRVQGIGFRPFIYKLAQENVIHGTVANTIDGVHIKMNGTPNELKTFIQGILERAPKQSKITSITHKEIDYEPYGNFSISNSDRDGVPDLLITPDFAICDRCKAELQEPDNRRYNYSYITCTECGPRFSIEKSLPYDRDLTSMSSFAMCEECEREFSSPQDHRFYSQTNSCPNCRISQWVTSHKGEKIALQEPELVAFVCDRIVEGNVVAVKGIGGFLLICDPKKEQAVNKLRVKKHRPTKPFALLYPDAGQMNNDFIVSRDELMALQSSAAPIILLKLEEAGKAGSLIPTIAPGLDRLGVMLPYAPLLNMIAEHFNGPLLATSGNPKGSPIAFKNDTALRSLGEIADYFIINNRDIQIPQDDSVVKYSTKHRKKIVIRRSRGYAPGFLQDAISPLFSEDVVAMGALLKSTFCIWSKGRCHISQYLGDTTGFDTQLSYEKTLRHFMKILQFNPEVVLVDKHPAYYSTHLGKELSADCEASIVEIQHHEAHLWAVLGEHKLLESSDKIMGVVFDGTGMGSDGAVWGGEFYIFESGKISRSNHINYFTHILGDKMAYEPRLSALSLLHSSEYDISIVKDLFSAEELDFYLKVLDNSSLQTSSMGRIFDAVSCILGLSKTNSYEGESAMYLECAAQRHCEVYGYPTAYPFSLTSNGSIDLKDTIHALINDLASNETAGAVGAKFHRTLVKAIEDMALRSGVNSIAFSGGVFQNALLVDMIIDHLEDKFRLYFHDELSPNDECISYGQLVGYYHSKRKGNRNESLIQSENHS